MPSGEQSKVIKENLLATIESVVVDYQKKRYAMPHKVNLYLRGYSLKL